MPGNPLSTFTVNEEQAGRPYDEQAPSGERWGVIQTTAAPKAVFDANTGPTSLKGVASGHVKVSSSGVIDSYPNTLSPDGIDKGWELNYIRRAGAYQDNGGMEIKYELLVPSAHNWEYLRIYQPDNYEHRRIVALELADYSEVGDWQAGDIVTAGGFSGEIYSIENNTMGNKDVPSIAIHKYSGGHPRNSIDTGAAVTNQRTGTTVTSAGIDLSETGMKFMSLWVDDGTPLDGYSNSGYLVGVVANYPQFDDDGGSGFATASVQLGYDLNQDTLQGPSSDFIGSDNPLKIYDTADNGNWVNIVVERKRSSALDVFDGIYRIWKKVERVGSPHEEWTLLFEKTNINRWSPYADNNFTHGYLFGNSNAGHYEDTKYYLNRWEYWTQKPTFLTDAGV